MLSKQRKQNILVKLAGTARKRQRLEDAKRSAMKRERSKGKWIFKQTMRPLHPKTALLEEKLRHLEKGQKAATKLREAKNLKNVGSAATRGLVALIAPWLPVHTTVTGARVAAERLIREGKSSKGVAKAIRKVLLKGKG